MRLWCLPALLAAAACASVDPSQLPPGLGSDPLAGSAAAAEQRLRDLGYLFDVTSVPGYTAYVLRKRDPPRGEAGVWSRNAGTAAEAIAPQGCTVASVTRESPDAFRVNYAC